MSDSSPTLQEAMDEHRAGRIEEARPDCAEAWNGLGLLIDEGGDTQGAMECWRKSIELRADYAELETALMDVYESALDSIRPGASMAELDLKVREGIAGMGYAGQPTHPICHGIGARAHEPPYPHQAGGGEFEEGMALAVEPGAYWPGGGGLRVEDNFLVTAGGVEKLSTFPDGVVRC